MQLQQFITFAFEGVDSRILPYIGAIASILSQFEIVDVLAIALLKDKYQLMLGTVERAHTTIILHPDTELT